MKEKIKEGGRGNYLKPNYLAEISPKDKYLGYPPRKILYIILKANIDNAVIEAKRSIT